jgi:decaprenylphospho-beta-D-ribofuranose 2-oxidase
MSRQVLTTFGRLDRTYSEVFCPTSAEQLRQVLGDLQQRRLSFRGGGYSFDSQSLNDDVVVSLRRLNRILRTDEASRQITAEPGVRWGEVVRHLRPLGLIPFSLVTTGQATVGGTASANCLSRCSPVYGKDGAHVESFQLVAPNGQVYKCSREENRDLFYAAIGGFGYLGVITEITYNLLPIGDRTRVETVLEKCDGFEELLPTLSRHTRSSEGWDAVYAVAFASGSGIRGLVLRSRYTAETRLRPLLIYRGDNPLRIPIEWLVRFPTISNLGWNLAFQFFLRENDRYVDDLLGYTFFVDGNRIAKEVAGRFGFNLTTIQQTFIIPEERAAAFLAEVSSRLRTNRLTPILFDILLIPADEFLLSASRDLAGFAISIAFERLTLDQIAILRRTLEDLSEVCAQEGGRVHLVKNVYATPQQLARMYGPAMNEFLVLKKRLDPEGILRNAFFDRLFGGVSAA